MNIETLNNWRRFKGAAPLVEFPAFDLNAEAAEEMNEDQDYIDVDIFKLDKNDLKNICIEAEGVAFHKKFVRFWLA